MDTSGKDAHTGHVIGGHKANLHNPNTSRESKQHSKEMLFDLEHGQGQTVDTSLHSGASTEGKNPGNVVGGYKATLKNPNVSDEAKQKAKDILDDMGS